LAKTPYGPSAPNVPAALERLRPIHPAYATLPIEAGFNWGDCLGELSPSGLYLVVFRSIRGEAADVALLIEMDDRAHEEAATAPGFLRYFKGQLSDRRECLSFCLWTGREFAQQAARRDHHVAAMSLTAEMYDSYVLERYSVTPKGRGYRFERIAPDHARDHTAQE
jgi:hypothetical protein